VGALEQLRGITNVVTKVVDGVTNPSTPWRLMTDTDSQVAGYSSCGNVGVGTEGANGRLKPDVVAPGSFVISTRSEQWDEQAYYNPTNYYFDEFSDLVDANSLKAYFIFPCFYSTQHGFQLQYCGGEHTRCAEYIFNAAVSQF